MSEETCPKCGSKIVRDGKWVYCPECRKQAKKRVTEVVR